MRITFLGTGTSHGVPRIGCDCAVCCSAEPKNTRLRSSILVENDGFVLVVDTTPDFRAQALAHRVRALHAILLTHAHADHINGMDDIRSFSRHGAIPCYASEETLTRICANFDYAVRDDLNLPGMPKITPVSVDGPFRLGSLLVTPFTVAHGHSATTAFRFDAERGNSFAYVTDCSAIPAFSERYLHSLDLLIIDALRHRPHPCHLTVEQALAIVRRFRPNMARLTHIDHDLDHEATNAQLPAGVELAYDGLIMEL